MTEFEMATIAARITAALIAAKATVVAASVPVGTTKITAYGLGPDDAVKVYQEVLAALTQSAP